MVLTAPLIDGVRNEGDAPRVGVAQVPFWWCSSQPQLNSRSSFPKTTDRCQCSYWKTFRPLESAGCACTPLLATYASTEDVAYDGCPLYGVLLKSEGVSLPKQFPCHQE